MAFGAFQLPLIARLRPIETILGNYRQSESIYYMGNAQYCT